MLLLQSGETKWKGKSAGLYKFVFVKFLESCLAFLKMEATQTGSDLSGQIKKEIQEMGKKKC